jgi:cytochrome P450
MIQITQSVLDTWKPGQNYNIANELRILTARVATVTLFSQDIGLDDAYAAKALASALSMLASPVLHLMPYDIPGFPFHRFLDVVGRFDVEMRKIVATKRQENKDNGDVLSMLLQTRDEESGVTLSEEEILGHVGVLFTAGHETSSSALTWTLLLLSQFPQWAAAAVDELDGVLHGDAPGVEQLGRLQVLERIIKESMRLFPPAPVRGSALSEATSIGGYLLPKGTAVFNSIYHTHHMQDLYTDPEEFRPDRWETIHPSIFEYNPFGGGARMCIGATFAMMELKIILAMMLQRYRLQCLPQVQVDRFGIVTIAPKGGLVMTVHEQDRQFTQGVGGVRGNIREMVSLPE